MAKPHYRKDYKTAIDLKSFIARNLDIYSVNELALIEYYLKLGKKYRVRDLLQYGFNEIPENQDSHDVQMDSIDEEILGSLLVPDWDHN
jgi:hypothetical protein